MTKRYYRGVRIERKLNIEPLVCRAFQEMMEGKPAPQAFQRVVDGVVAKISNRVILRATREALAQLGSSAAEAAVQIEEFTAKLRARFDGQDQKDPRQDDGPNRDRADPVAPDLDRADA